MSETPDLTALVRAKIELLGPDAPAYFGVPAGMIAMWRKGVKPPNVAAAQKVLNEQVPSVPEMQIVAEPEPVIGTEQMVLLMPIYENIEPLLMITLIRCLKLYGMEKVTIIPVTRTLIDEARNTLVQKFMAIESKPEWAVFLDADQILPCGHGGILRKMGLDLPEPKASRNALVRIMSHPKEYRIVGALYGNRRGNHKPAVELAYKSEAEDKRIRGFFDGTTKTDGLEETGWIGMGLARFHRSVFEEMQAAAVPGGVLADIAPPVGRERDAFGYFGRTSQWRGEDIALCRRCQKISIKTYLDTGLILGHQGKQYSM